MISFLIWLVGTILSIKAVLEVLKMPISMAGKVICTVLLLVCSWVGLAVYYFYAKDKIVEWFK